MAGSPPFKVYRGKEYIGSAKHPEDAAAFVLVCGTTVRYGHGMKVWDSDSDGSLPYDQAAQTMIDRIRAHYDEVSKRREMNQGVAR